MSPHFRKVNLITAGVDAGASSTDAVVQCAGEALGWSVVSTGAHPSEAAERASQEALLGAGASADEVCSVIATGYGRSEVAFAVRTVTEVTCHAVGARALFPRAASVIDVGAQDAKVIRLASNGRVEDFVMNDKCAAGTGRFIEVMAQALNIRLEEMGKSASRSERNLRISATCTVFAESEVVGLIGEGYPVEEIAAAIHCSVADRIYGMIRRVRSQGPFVFSGGVAKNSGVVCALRNRLQAEILVPSEPQIVGALGAAILAESGNCSLFVSTTSSRTRSGISGEPESPELDSGSA